MSRQGGTPGVPVGDVNVAVRVPSKAPEDRDGEARNVSLAPVGAETSLNVCPLSPDGPGQELKARCESRGVSAEGSVAGGSEKPGIFERASDGTAFFATTSSGTSSAGRLIGGVAKLGREIEVERIGGEDKGEF